MSEQTFFNRQARASEAFPATPGKNSQGPEDRCAELVTTLENCEKQLRHVRLELTELQRTGPREEFSHLKSNRVAIERKIEKVGSLISSCSASWNAFHSKNAIVRVDRNRSENIPYFKPNKRTRLAQR